MIKQVVPLVAILALLCTTVLGQAPTDKKEKEPEQETLTVTVKSVSGSAEVRESADGKWKAVQVGDTYGEGAEIRTGYKAKVELAFADNSKAIIERVSHFKVDKFRQSGTKVVTRSRLSYGKIKAGVEKGPESSDYEIVTSLGALAVNGTDGINLEVDPGANFVNLCLIYSGNIGWNTGTGSECSVDPGGCTDQDGTRQDLMGRRSNNIGLLDRFGSTGIEDALGGSYGNQLNKLQTTDPKNLLPPVPQTGHSVMNGY